jgi:MCM P-loop domain
MKLIEPYLAGSPDAAGEIDMFCPVHEDTRRSARVNPGKNLWFCHGCGEGGPIPDLISLRRDWLEPHRNGAVRSPHMATDSEGRAPLSEALVRSAVKTLRRDPGLSDALLSLKHLTSDTLARFEIGWDGQAFTIPVRDEHGELVNIRRYNPFPSGGRDRKMWNTAGFGSPARLYPIEALSVRGPIIICEGEWDALATIQRGFNAITRTSGASTWKMAWNRWFAGRDVYLAQDCDREGQKGNAKIGRALSGVASSIRVLPLPFPVIEKGGQDLGDYWELHTSAEFTELLETAAPFAPELIEQERFGSIGDASDASKVAIPLRIPLTVKGKSSQGFTVAHEYEVNCTNDAGAACEVCPMNGLGSKSGRVEPSDPIVLELFDCTARQVRESLRVRESIPKCTKLAVEVKRWQSVETLFARPSIEHGEGGADLFRTLKLTTVGAHDTPPNATVQVLGALHPNPRTQGNEFLTWEVNRMRSELDNFEADRETLALLEQYRPSPNQSPLAKAVDIARDQAAHVTLIQGRTELHVAIDLVYHSVLEFDFNKKREHHGWLELLVVGDTRTGKSEVATRLAAHYGAGEVISCESATFAGVVAAVQQFGGKEWTVTWGAIPINDRRLVVLDEVSGLTTQEISQLSFVRSTGIVQIQKVAQETARARTRLVWLGNPREARMSNFTYGVQAIKQLIGNNEDIARFDFAMSLASDDVPLELINQPPRPQRQLYGAEGAGALVRWAWSRTAEDVVYSPGAVELALSEANRLGRAYADEPPLIQGADVRNKIARMAAALAARTFSSPDGIQLLVDRSHVQGAVKFLEHIYNMEGFGYGEISRMRSREHGEGQENMADVAAYLKGRGQLAQFLTSNSSFRRFDLEEVLNISKDEANAIIAALWEKRMVRKERGNLIVQPVLHTILRGAKL